MFAFMSQIIADTWNYRPNTKHNWKKRNLNKI